MVGLALALALWTSLGSAEPARGLATPDKGGAGPGPRRWPPPTRSGGWNLSCFQCFKASSWSKCVPAECRAEESVCVSQEVIIFTGRRAKVQISKRCAIRCPNSNSWFEWQPGPKVQGRIIRQCCSEHLCNAAPDAPEGLGVLPGGLLLLVGLGILWTLG